LSRIYGEYKVLDETVLELTSYLEERFGIPVASWEHYKWAQREGTRAIWVLGKSGFPPVGVNLDTWGITAFRTMPPDGYPTNAFMRAFGHLAQDGFFELNSSEGLTAYMEGGSTVDGVPPKDRGYCIVRHRGLALGRGKWTGEELISDLPKAFRTPVKPKQDAG